MPLDSILAAAAAGATLVTPNNRLARRLSAAHDRAQRAAGARTWASAQALPWGAWVESLWHEALAAGAVDARPNLAPDAAAHVWRRILAAEFPADGPRPLDLAGLAAQAASAWRIVHEWGAGGESWRAWAGGDGEPARFSGWAERYRAEVDAAGALDRSQLSDGIAATAGAVAAWRTRAVVLAGFVEFAPQQQRLLSALRDAGMTVVEHEALAAAPAAVREAAVASPDAELAAAFGWARRRSERDPAALIGVVIPDLEARLATVADCAEDHFGRPQDPAGTPHAARGWNVSLGASLADQPVVAAALTLVAIAHGRVPATAAATLLRSACLPEAADAWCARAGVERRWLEGGRAEVGWSDVTAALEPIDAELAGRWRELPRQLPPPRRASPREWTAWWQRWLEATGWPGDAVRERPVREARGAWDQFLAGFAALEAVEPRLGSGEAVGLLAARAADTPFQPESAAAPIQILGLLEAVGLPFDALWVTGMAADAWPPAPQPNPLLPLAWQRERGVPRADASRELAYARKLTDRLLRGAPEVIFSWPRRVDDRAGMRSPLLPTLAALEAEAIAAADPRDRAEPGAGATGLDHGPARRQFAAQPRLETRYDGNAPPLAGEPLTTGSRVIAAQSECPFQALADVRWDAQPWPPPLTGLGSAERGTLVHAAMAAFWRDVRTQARLLELEATGGLDARIGAAAQAAVGGLSATRRRELPAVVLAGEADRLARTLRDWLVGVDRGRPPFVVRDVESGGALAFPGLRLRLRFDRVDALDDGGVALIDYKSGAVAAPGKWFEARPQAPQLAVYALAQRAAEPEVAIRAVAYARLKPGEVKPVGVAADAAAWPALTPPQAIRTVALADWAAVEAHWTRVLGALAADFVAGRADVLPRNQRESCRDCGRQALCRVGEDVAIDNDGNGDDGSNNTRGSAGQGADDDG
jgi:probable DNA repair protein